jgi:hypothetical protein
MASLLGVVSMMDRDNDWTIFQKRASRRLHRRLSPQDLVNSHRRPRKGLSRHGSGTDVSGALLIMNFTVTSLGGPKRRCTVMTGAVVRRKWGIFWPASHARQTHMTVGISVGKKCRSRRKLTKGSHKCCLAEAEPWADREGNYQ